VIITTALLVVKLWQSPYWEPIQANEKCFFEAFGDAPPVVSKEQSVIADFALIEAVEDGRTKEETIDERTVGDRIERYWKSKRLTHIEQNTRGFCIGVVSKPLADSSADVLIYKIKVLEGQFKGQTVWSSDAEPFHSAASEPDYGGTPAPPTHWWPVTDFIGEGAKRTEPFKVSAPWRIIWVINPKDDESGADLLQVYIERPGEDTPVDLAANVSNVGLDMDEHYIYKGGIFDLNINSIGRYAVHVQEWRQALMQNGRPYRRPRRKQGRRKK